ncbi:motility associated factor glycosyltransferase family protein [Campylobacter troglodytis]|uniref:motility associated factor glycosyltransferase family protein n=1 Tax=Campylobacter troglodytis TaxID=654363 RepID=UPI00115A867E|nr:motility associated factor glycosyltransferase family protein [Campylobacter troglodytis]TQR60426.1 hypothetical protein DMC01_05920 [Campylobacter troglodytis]
MGGGGATVAFYALQAAAYLRYKKIILIGQDLAYANDLASHAKGHLIGEFYDTNRFEKKQVLAYGGKGKVLSHELWLYFKGQIEGLISSFDKSIAVINSTEGGARIEGAIEMPFVKVCESFITKDKKQFAPLSLPSKKTVGTRLLRAYVQMKKYLLKSEQLREGYELRLSALQGVVKELQGLNSLDYNTNKEYFSKAEEIITELKNELEDQKRSGYVYEIIASGLLHFEQELGLLFVYKPKNEIEKNEKMFLWIARHIELLANLINCCIKQKELIEDSLNSLKNAIKEEGKELASKMLLIDKKDEKALIFS